MFFSSLATTGLTPPLTQFLVSGGTPISSIGILGSYSAEQDPEGNNLEQWLTKVLSKEAATQKLWTEVKLKAVWSTKVVPMYEKLKEAQKDLSNPDSALTRDTEVHARQQKLQGIIPSLPLFLCVLTHIRTTRSHTTSILFGAPRRLCGGNQLFDLILF